VVNAYTLMLGALVLVGGSLGDVFGERRVFAAGLCGFGAASLACGLAPSATTLIAARALQGIAGALVTPAALAVIIATFEPDERGTAIGRWTAWSGAASLAGPLVGGPLVEAASWRWIFLVNLPLVAVTVWLVVRYVPASRRAQGREIDLPGAALAAVGLGGPVFALIEQPRLGWSSPAVGIPLIVGAVCLIAFTVRERMARDPMLPLQLFARRDFTVGNIHTLALYAGLSILFSCSPCSSRR
jgi:MFS family permease